MCHLYKNLFTDRPHFRVAIFRFPFHCHSQRLKRFATSDRRVLMLPRVRAMRACICHEEIHAIRERMKKRFHGATTQSISLFIFFSLFFFSLTFCTSPLSALEPSRTLPLAPMSLRLFPLHPRQSFRSATFTLPCQAAVEVFCNPRKDVPHEKIDFTPGRALCHVLKRI